MASSDIMIRLTQDSYNKMLCDATNDLFYITDLGMFLHNIEFGYVKKSW